MPYKTGNPAVMCGQCGWAGDKADLVNESGNTREVVDAGGAGSYEFDTCPNCGSLDVDDIYEEDQYYEDEYLEDGTRVL